MAKTSALLALLLSTGTAAFAAGNCYTVYDTSNRAVYQSTEPPIDMSRSISDGMARRFPGHYLVMAPDSGLCQEIADESRFASRAVANLGDSGTAVAGSRARALRDPLDSKLFRDAQPLMFSAVGADRGSESDATFYPRGSDARQPGTAVRLRNGKKVDDAGARGSPAYAPEPNKSP